VEAFRRWLAARPERSIAVVSHHGLLRCLTGHDFQNCELRSALLSDLLAPEEEEVGGAALSVGSSADSASSAAAAELLAAVGVAGELDALMVGEAL
jgi:hypothetical protein